MKSAQKNSYNRGATVKFTSFFSFLLVGELLAQPWACSYRVEAGECAYKPSG